MLVYIFVVALAYFIYARLRIYHKHWENKNIPFEIPTPLFGNLGPNLLRKVTFCDMVQSWYQKHANERFFGIYQFYHPTLIVKDPELIKQITVKEFDTFRDRRTFAAEDIDPLWAKNLAAMKGDEGWHDMRSTLSPSFTSSKMKLMFELMRDCAQQFTDYFLEQGGTVTVEMKDAYSRFSNDVIGTTAFGVTCNSLKDKENEFYIMGKELANFSGIKELKFFLSTLCPTLMKLLNIEIFSKQASDFFRNLVRETLRMREEKGIVRPDMIHLLMEAQKDRLKGEQSNTIKDVGFSVIEESDMSKSPKKQKTMISDEDITAQVLIFFLGGFDTVSTMMTFASYELAVNPDIQENLHREIYEIIEQHNGQLTYEGLVNMKYLDMIVSETLRKWPPGPLVDRLSVKPFRIEPQLLGEKPLTLETGTHVWIPIEALHKDPQYYPNPERFDPERFNEENKHNIKPFTYIPFGAGPRSCIASRFAILELKLGLAEIVRKFEIVPVGKTDIPLQMNKGSIAPKAKNGMWLGLKPR